MLEQRVDRRCRRQGTALCGEGRLVAVSLFSGHSSSTDEGEG